MIHWLTNMPEKYAIFWISCWSFILHICVLKIPKKLTLLKSHVYHCFTTHFPNLLDHRNCLQGIINNIILRNKLREAYFKTDSWRLTTPLRIWAFSGSLGWAMHTIHVTFFPQKNTLFYFAKAIKTLWITNLKN